MFVQVMYGETAVFKQLFKTKHGSFRQVDEGVYKVFAQLSTTKEDELDIQYDNLFFIPGSHYVPPYIGKYICENDSEAEQRVSKALTKGFYLDIVQLNQFIDQESHNV